MVGVGGCRNISNLIKSYDLRGNINLKGSTKKITQRSTIIIAKYTKVYNHQSIS